MLQVWYPCPSVAIRGPKNQTSKADRTPKKTSDLATDGHGCGVPASSRSPGEDWNKIVWLCFGETLYYGSSPLFKIPHGGLGIGGVLFGSLEAGRAPNQA